MAGSIFGLGADLDVQAACISLIAIVIFTVGFEVFTHRLDHKLEGTAYKEMVDKIYQGKLEALARNLAVMSPAFLGLGELLREFFGVSCDFLHNSVRVMRKERESEKDCGQVACFGFLVVGVPLN